MSTEFILENIPSFFAEQLKDSVNGSNPISTIHQLFANVLGDGLSKSLQNLNSLSIERISPLTYEYYKVFDTSTPVNINYIILNSTYNYLYYEIDNKNICGIDNLYLDVLMNTPVPPTFTIGADTINTYSIFKDLTTGKKYLAISVNYLLTFIKQPQNFYAKVVYNNDSRLANTYGVLVNYTPSIQEYINIDSSGKFYICDLNTTINNAISYKQELIGLFYVLWNGPTITDISIGLSIYSGSPYAEFDGTIISMSSGSTNNITIQSLDKKQTKTYSFTQTVNPNLANGLQINRFTILTTSAATIIDYFSDPVNFKNYISSNINSLIGINTSIKEEYPNLNWDNPNLIWDSDCPLYWDMGNYQTGDPNFLTDAPYGYEEFRNIFIITSTYNQSAWQDKFEFFLNKIKPIWTKYLLIFN